MICLCVLLLSTIPFSMLSKSDTGGFAIDFYDQIVLILSGDFVDVEDNNLSLLLKAFEFYLPNTITEWLLGSGLVVGDEGKIIVLDSGFFYDLYFGGVLFIFICFLIPLFFYNYLKSIHKYFALFLILSCVILNIKGPFVPFAHGFKLITLVCMYFMLHPNIIERQSTHK